jgi:hypothetical protein
MSTPWQPPPPDMLARAEQEYHAARDDLDRLITAVRDTLADGIPEIEAVTDVWLSLRMHQHNPATALLGAAAIMRLAKMSMPEPAQGTGRRQNPAT